MNQRIVALIVSLVAVSAVVSGCKQLTPQGMAQQATQTLGLPVFLWAYSDDVCANRQLNALVSEFRGHHAASDLTSRFASTYSAVIVNQSQDQGEVTGDLKILQLWNGRHTLTSSRILQDTRKTATGKFAGTQLDKGDAAAIEGKVLVIQPMKAEDKSIKTVYYTNEPSVFADLTVAGGGLSVALDHSQVYVATAGMSDSDPCGTLVSISDLF